MKKMLLIIPTLLFSLLSFSQGIVFEQGTWKEVLAKAQLTNKPIFVDIYTTWCGPCKQMSSNVFPLETVGNVFNEKFICYQIDAEKGEGIEIAKKYGVKAYPTYLFIKGDGNLFYLTVGSMPEKSFIAVAKTALDEMNDPKPLTIWDKEYIVKKNDPAFLLDYMKKRSKLGLSNDEIFDEYLKIIPEEQRTSKTVVNWYNKALHHMKVNTFAYSNLQKNSAIFDTILYSKLRVLLIDGIVNTVNEASLSKDEHLLATAILTYDNLPKNQRYSMHRDEVYMLYYKNTGENDKYIKYAIDFGNNYLMKMSVDSLAQKDKSNLQSLEKDIKAGMATMFDSTQLKMLLTISRNLVSSMIAKSLNTISREVFKKVTDKNILQYALGYSKRSLELMPDQTEYLDSYANLYYKLGLKDEAITFEKKALSLVDKKDVEGAKIMVETIRKMNAGEKTW